MKASERIAEVFVRGRMDVGKGAARELSGLIAPLETALEECLAVLTEERFAGRKYIAVGAARSALSDAPAEARCVSDKVTTPETGEDGGPYELDGTMWPDCALVRRIRELERELREVQAVLCECADYYHGLWGDESGTSWREQPNERAARWRRAAGVEAANNAVRGAADPRTLDGLVGHPNGGGQ